MWRYRQIMSVAQENGYPNKSCDAPAPKIVSQIQNEKRKSKNLQLLPTREQARLRHYAVFVPCAQRGSQESVCGRERGGAHIMLLPRYYEKIVLVARTRVGGHRVALRKTSASTPLVQRIM